ncbi:MAG: 3-dehydroquinate dehydratase [Oligoflexales bacterium]|nr:3-dehydroquinate dehydratase [Oligoflexales bacterium]
MNQAPDKPYEILIANGVNLDLLGRREKQYYGTQSLLELQSYLETKSKDLLNKFPISLSFFQSNDESQFLSELSKPWDGAIINPGAWTHTSLALADRLAALRLCFVEVHLSKIAEREEFRQRSYCAVHAIGTICGLGFDSYLAGLLALALHLEKTKSEPKASPN